MSPVSVATVPEYASNAVLDDVPIVARKGVAMLQRAWETGSLDVVFPNGRHMLLHGRKSGPAAVLTVRDFNFIRRVLTAGDIGFCDGYKENEWDTPELAALLEVLTLNSRTLGQLFTGNILTRALNRIVHVLHRNTRSGSRRNIFAHYDLGNSFYETWLDASMTYSSAFFGGRKIDLTNAQIAKYARLADLVDLKPGQHVLEIGCGWGGFAQYAAEVRGAHVTGVTISQAQHDYAVERMRRLGLDDKVDIRLMDYRDIDGQYDAVVSIEMFEAVGEAYWGAYFDKVHKVLKPGGKAGLQIITIADETFEAYRKRAGFIQKYIFPGGMLPSLSKLTEHSRAAGLTLLSNLTFGKDYAETLKEWAQRFEKAWQDGRIEGFDAPFRKLWLFYLAYCEAGFRTARTDVVHLQLQRAG